MPAGRPKTFENGEQIIELYKQFCRQIVEDGFRTTPTLTEFSRWLEGEYHETDRRTLWKSLNEYYPEVKSEFESIRADIITQGAMLGAYHNSMSIFALKNWCNWKDKTENEVKADTTIDVSIKVIDG